MNKLEGVRFYIPDQATDLDEYLAKSGPHKYISRKKVKGKWVYEYKDDAVKRMVNLLLDFLSNPKRSVTLGQAARSFRVNKVMAKEVIDTLAKQGKIQGTKNDKGIYEYRQAVPKEEKPKKVETEKQAVKRLSESEQYSSEELRQRILQYMHKEKMVVPGRIARVFGIRVDQVLFHFDKMKEAGFIVHKKSRLPEENRTYRLSQKGKEQARGEVVKEEPKKVITEPPKKTKKELQEQKKDLQKEAQKVVATGGQLSLDFVVKQETVEEQIQQADTNENAEKVVGEFQKPKKEKKSKKKKTIKVGGKEDGEFTKEIGEHVWGSRADKWAALNSSDDLKTMTPAQQTKLCVKAKLLPKVTPEQMLERGATPGCVMLRKAVEKCIQSKSGDNDDARAYYVDGITFVSRSLDACKTEQDVQDFLRDWLFLAQGKRELARHSEKDVERMKFDYAKERGLIRDLTFEQLETWNNERTARAKEIREMRIQANRASSEGRTKDVNKALAQVNKLEEKQAALSRKIRESGGGQLNVIPIHDVIALHHGISKYGMESMYDRTGGEYILYHADPDLEQEVRKNPYAKYAAGLGKNMLNLVGSTHPDFYGPKAYKDASREVRKWDRSEFTNEKKTEEMFKYLEPKKRGEGRKRRYVWERDVPGEIDRIGGPKVKAPPTVEEFAETFGLTNVQMGNWVKRDESAAKSHLAGAHGAFLDLADLMGVDPKTISLNGRLAMAFGGRGSGNARAHYESAGQIINITKIAGGGSLAHEWAHAMDNILCVAHSSGGTKGMPMGSDGDYRNLPPKVAEAYEEVISTIRYGVPNEGDAVGADTTARRILRDGDCSYEERKELRKRIYGREPETSHFYRDAVALNGPAGQNGYWTRGHEMFARAFESYIEDTLAENKRKSSYLVSGTQGDKGKTGTARPDWTEKEGRMVKESRTVRMYPDGDERRAINKAMAKLVKALAEENALEKALRILDHRFVLGKANWFGG